MGVQLAGGVEMVRGAGILGCRDGWGVEIAGKGKQRWADLQSLGFLSHLQGWPQA